jgi:hypothetical protein
LSLNELESGAGLLRAVLDRLSQAFEQDGSSRTIPTV